MGTAEVCFGDPFFEVDGVRSRKFHKVCIMKLSRFRGSLHEFQQKTYGVNSSLRQYFHEGGPLLCAFGSRTVDSSSGPLVEKHVKRYDPAVPHDDEIPPGVSRHFTRASRYPWNHSCIAIFLRSGSHLISKVGMSRLDRARDAIDLVAATNSALAGIVEHAIFSPEFVDGRTPTRGIVFAEHVAKISD